MIGRRAIVRALAYSVTTLAMGAPRYSIAQRPVGIPRLGFLTPGAGASSEEPFWNELQRLGYARGKNIAVEYRSSHGDFKELASFAADLVRLKVDIIVAVVTQASLAAKQATSTIPIVMIGVVDPIAAGLVGNLARPGGNITGTSGAGLDIVAKQLELVRTLVPGATRVTALWNPSNRVFQQQMLNEARSAASKLGLQLGTAEAQAPDDLAGTFAAISRNRPDALLILADPMLGSQASRIADFAIKQRLPAVSMIRGYAEAGALATYGQSFEDSYRRAAVYVDRILKGARPGDLPVEQTTSLELVVNLKTAKALGSAIPQSVLLRADHVIR